MPSDVVTFRSQRVFVDGVSVADLAEAYGTPAYVYSARRIQDNFNRVRKAFGAVYHNLAIHYAIKACNTLPIAKLLVDLGSGIDAASPNEIRLAQALGVTPSLITFTGNNLSDVDLQFAADSGVTINLDDDSYLERLLRIARPAIISFRINPGLLFADYTTNPIGPFTGPQAKFGVSHDRVSLAYGQAKRAGIRRAGAHMMPHSNERDFQRFQEVTSRFLDILLPAIVEHEMTLEFIDLGGGLGIPYQRDEDPLDLDRMASGVAATITQKCGHYGVPLPKLILEPARYFVADAAVLIGRVHGMKETEARTLIGTDISMNVFPRPALYGAQHRIHINGRHGEETSSFGVCGQVCENADLWSKSTDLPLSTRVGDLIVVEDVGAYGFAMSYEYNGRLRPCEVLVRDGNHELVRRREELADTLQTTVWTPKPLDI